MSYKIRRSASLFARASISSCAPGFALIKAKQLLHGTANIFRTS